MNLLHVVWVSILGSIIIGLLLVPLANSHGYSIVVDRLTCTAPVTQQVVYQSEWLDTHPYGWDLREDFAFRGDTYVHRIEPGESCFIEHKRVQSK